MKIKILKGTFSLCLIALISATSLAQVSVDEAQRRLQEKLVQKQPTTQPANEVDRLRQENLRLRERVMSLESEVGTLKESLARASADARHGGPATRPAEVAPDADGLQKPLLGLWRGGDITTGSGYLLQFNSNGTYHQTFITSGQKESGQYHAFPDGTMEMWNDKWPEDKKHNQYQLAATSVQLTLTPVVQDGVEVRTPKAVVLSKAE